jgi:hypothetical protein
MRGASIVRQVQVFDLPLDYPASHRVNVQPNNIASYAIGLDKRCSSPHEWVNDDLTLKIVRSEELLA